MEERLIYGNLNRKYITFLELTKVKITKKIILNSIGILIQNKPKNIIFLAHRLMNR